MSRPSSSNPWTKVAIFSKCQSGTQHSSAPCFIKSYHSERIYNDPNSVTAYNPGFRITTTDRRGTTTTDRVCVDHLKDHNGFRRIIRQNSTDKPEDPSDLHTHLAHNYLAWPPERSSSGEANCRLSEKDGQTLKNAEYLLRGFDRRLEAATIATAQMELTNCPLTDQTRSEYVKSIGKWSKGRCLNQITLSPNQDRTWTSRPIIMERRIRLHARFERPKYLYSRTSATTPSRMAGRSTSLLGSARTVVLEEYEDEDDDDDLGPMVHGVSTLGDDDGFVAGPSVRAGSHGYTSSPLISRRCTRNA